MRDAWGDVYQAMSGLSRLPTAAKLPPDMVHDLNDTVDRLHAGGAVTAADCDLLLWAVLAVDPNHRHLLTRAVFGLAGPPGSRFGRSDLLTVHDLLEDMMQQLRDRYGADVVDAAETLIRGGTDADTALDIAKEIMDHKVP
jgi:hypothetical protein